MATEAQKKLVAQLDANKEKLIDRLARAVEIPSVSGDAAYRKHVFEMADFLVAELKALGATTELKPLGKQILDGQEIELPPVILADYGNDPKKKTILVYGVSVRKHRSEEAQEGKGGLGGRRRLLYECSHLGGRDKMSLENLAAES